MTVYMCSRRGGFYSELRVFLHNQVLLIRVGTRVSLVPTL
jgi:hypothetical protein